NLLRPEISVRGRSDSLRYGSLSVTGLIFDSLTDTAHEKGQVSVIVSSIRPYRSSRVYRKCALDLSGTLSSHDLTVSCGAQSGSYLSVHGGYSKNENIYDAKLSSLMLVNNIIEPVTLIEPVSLTYDLNTSSGTVSKISLTDGQSTLFVDNFKISDQGFAADYELSNLNLFDLSKLLPDKTIISGILNTKGSVGYKNSIPEIDAEMSLSKGYLRKAQLFIPFESTNATVHTDYRKAELDFKSQLFRDLGLIDLNLRIDSPYSVRKLGGSLKVKGLNLGVFAPSATSFLNTLKGSSEVELTFGGTVKKPELYGKVNLKGSAEPSYNLGTVNSFDLSLDACGTTAKVLGKANLNDADVDITGDLDFSESAKGQLRLSAREVPVFLLNYGESVVNIDLLAGLSENISLTGAIDIPRGLIKFKSIENSAQSPSPDEIFVDDKNSLKKVVKSIKTNEVNSSMAINVDVSLGDDVKVDAMGLKANAVGGFTIIKKPEDSTLFGNGKLSLVNGRIDMYGHKFVVNKADAIFKGELLDPFFDAEVVADQSTIEDDVLAGVTVKGPS
ncbi:MAG: translocation/assembly module TamB domain-containing protein, partial [Succinivibrio sp.]